MYSKSHVSLLSVNSLPELYSFSSIVRDALAKGTLAAPSAQAIQFLVALATSAPRAVPTQPQRITHAAKKVVYALASTAQQLIAARTCQKYRYTRGAPFDRRAVAVASAGGRSEQTMGCSGPIHDKDQQDSQ
jgi:hypothetical protein